jgi:hypothetical protein
VIPIADLKLDKLSEKMIKSKNVMQILKSNVDEALKGAS